MVRAPAKAEAWGLDEMETFELIENAKSEVSVLSVAMQDSLEHIVTVVKGEDILTDLEDVDVAAYVLSIITKLFVDDLVTASLIDKSRYRLQMMAVVSTMVPAADVGVVGRSHLKKTSITF